MREEKHSSGGWIALVIIIILLVIAGIYIFSNSQAKQAVCGTHTETYTNTVKGCDKMQNCQCLHESWGGLGACDSCQCTKEVSNC